MKTLSFFARTSKNLLCLVLVLFSINGFSQAASAKTETKTQLTTLQDVVDGIKEKNQLIKNVDCVNVMVNDKLVYNLQDVTINPKSISMVEVLVLEPKAGSSNRINPSIIINTKN